MNIVIVANQYHYTPKKTGPLLSDLVYFFGFVSVLNIRRVGATKYMLEFAAILQVNPPSLPGGRMV